MIVQKFGGSSVADADRIRHCASRVGEAVARGRKPIVVVSAMGDTTDDLIELAAKVSSAPSKREMDQLLATGEQVSISLFSMALHGLGYQAVSLTGQQAGVVTDGFHTRARVRTVDATRLHSEISRGRIPVVAGFQGVSPEGEVTTLGRGGSDTSAVALAAAVGAEEAEIYTDVDGVYTSDPRIVPGARLLPRISYDEMMEAASQGAKVMHLRSVELGKHHGVPIRVLHAMRHGPGTLITHASLEEPPPRSAATMNQMETQQAVSSVAMKADIGRVTLTGLPNRPGVQREIFERIAAGAISVDDILQTEEPEAAGAAAEGSCSLVFTVDKTDLADVRAIVAAALASIGGGYCRVDLGLAKVSAVGVGMQSQPGVAARMFRALAEAGIRVNNVTTSEIKISCIVAEADAKQGTRAVHQAFGLEQEPRQAVSSTGHSHHAGSR